MPHLGKVVPLQISLQLALEQPLSLTAVQDEMPLGLSSS